MTVRKLIKELQDLGEDKLDLEVFHDTERGWDWVTDVRVTIDLNGMVQRTL